ncbi:MAG: DUF4252 domain-containing protein [Candidatus Krumholzibacteria bacterium]|nr:DUF4252 domain-containing protein [Candidatus Krumholzibacteria bacterium]
MKTQHRVGLGTGAALFALLAAALLAAGPASAEKEEAVQKHPGYVDFAGLKLFEGKEAKVEVYLREPLINLVSGFVKHEDEELYEILSRLKLVRVLVYDADDVSADQFLAASSETAKRLDKDGWERIVRVRDEDERADIYIKASKDYSLIEGIVVMALDDDDEAVFVNIVGAINPEEIGRLGEHFDIDGLEGIHVDTTRGKKN